MSKLYILFAMIATISLLATCYSRNNKSSGIGLIGAGKIAEIRVTALDIRASGHKSFKTISTSTEIDKLVSFADERVLARSILKSDIDNIFTIQDRSTQVSLAFYQSDKYLGTLGLGYYDTDKYFIKYYTYGESKVAVVSSKQKKQLLDLIGYSEHEFGQLNLAK